MRTNPACLPHIPTQTRGLVPHTIYALDSGVYPTTAVIHKICCISVVYIEILKELVLCILNRYFEDSIVHILYLAALICSVRFWKDLIMSRASSLLHYHIHKPYYKNTGVHGLDVLKGCRFTHTYCSSVNMFDAYNLDYLFIDIGMTEAYIKQMVYSPCKSSHANFGIRFLSYKGIHKYEKSMILRLNMHDGQV